MKDYERIISLIRIIEGPSNGTRRDCDKKRVAVSQLGILGDETALPTLLDAVENYTLCEAAIYAIGRIRFERASDNNIKGIISVLERKINDGTTYQRSAAINTLLNIAQQKAEQKLILDEIEDVLKRKNNNETMKALEVIKRFKDLNKRISRPPEPRKKPVKTRVR
jgi:HEAT repeat protein